MARDSLHTAVDLGTSKVTTLMSRLGRDGVPELIGVGISASQGVRKGVEGGRGVVIGILQA